MYKKILVTGGGGFIGSNVVEKLLSMTETEQVVVLDNFSTGRLENVEPFMENKKFKLIIGNMCDSKICDDACQDVDAIICLAALGSVPRSMKTPHVSHDNNVDGFAKILNSAYRNNVKRFIYASSSAVYGNTKDLTNLDHCKPISFYGLTKHVNDLYASYYTKYFGMECIGLRFHNVFGKNQPFNGEYSAVIPIFIRNAKKGNDLTVHGDGSQYRDFTHVSNVVHINLLCLQTTNKDIFGKSIDVGAGCKIDVLTLANEIKNRTKSESSIVHVDRRKGDIDASYAHMEQSKVLLGYKPVTNFSEGINRTIQNFTV